MADIEKDEGCRDRLEERPGYFDIEGVSEGAEGRTE